MPLRGRAVTHVEGSVQVSAAVPGEEETAALFGAPLYRKGIQPVWLEISNGSGRQLRFMPVGMDDDYFSPHEVAFINRSGFSKSARAEMASWYHELAMPRQIPPGKTRSGFVFTNASPGTKSFNVDLISAEEDISISFFVDVPGFVPDHATVDFESLYDPSQLLQFEGDGLRDALESQPCCTADSRGQYTGLPLTAVLVGTGSEILEALLRADWYETAVDADAGDPDAGQFLYGRIPDAVFRILRDDKRDRNEMSLWLSPMRLDGEAVWIAQITHFIGKRTQLEEFIFGARVDPDVDDARNYQLQNMWYSQSLDKIGWVNTGRGIPIEEMATAIGGTGYFTDGYLVVLWLSGDPVSLLDTRSVKWDRPPSR